MRQKFAKDLILRSVSCYKACSLLCDPTTVFRYLKLCLTNLGHLCV